GKKWLELCGVKSECESLDFETFKNLVLQASAEASNVKLSDSLGVQALDLELEIPEEPTQDSSAKKLAKFMEQGESILKRSRVLFFGKNVDAKERVLILTSS